MPFLFEKIDGIREAGYVTPMPSYIASNLNPNFDLRPYQVQAFENYITYFENPGLRVHPTQTLFHMATGSGKTLIMAGLIVYLYHKGYRNFLFFVNLSNIVRKTKDNFLNHNSSKYLFAEEIRVDGDIVPINEVQNFQFSDPNAINICFTTTQGLHADMWITKENALTLDDFSEKKVVLISDEAHHLNADTLQGNTSKMNVEEEDAYHSWESTVRSIFESNVDNILLEFTATCDIGNPYLKDAYSNKIIYDYPLVKFRADKYSKEIMTLRSDIPLMDRALQAIILSQYRLKVFQDQQILMKPVVLFKSAKKLESKQNRADFLQMISDLDGADIRRIENATDSDIIKKAFSFFKEKKITNNQLAQELKEDFGETHIISVNDVEDADEQQLLLNSLEDPDNPYRAIFEVKKLDEGWDVLNLYDIVRLYETRDSRNGKPGKTTITEAQLIGRGARYFPFQITSEQPRYQRKYDDDITNPLRICEELYYHCQNNSRYIDELKTALREVGIDLDDVVTINHSLKASFKKEDLYKTGLVFTNRRLLKSRNDVHELLPSLRDTVFSYSEKTGKTAEGNVFDDTTSTESTVITHKHSLTISRIADINYSIVHKSICKYSVLRFDTLHKRFPNLDSMRSFIYNPDYLGNIKIEITSKNDDLTPQVLYDACNHVMSTIAESVSSIEEAYEGSREFNAQYFHEVFKDKQCNFTRLHDGGQGISQNDNSVPEAWKMDLSKEDWFVFEDNYGTSEEKAFVAYFKDHVAELKKQYSKVYLVRNERQLKTYSFNGGERFEPDYLLFLQSPLNDGFEQLQVFIEPKGTHLLEKDAWKEKFMLQIKDLSIPVKLLVDDNMYRIWGLHFFNQDFRSDVFKKDMDYLITYKNLEGEQK